MESRCFIRRPPSSLDPSSRSTPCASGAHSSIASSSTSSVSLSRTRTSSPTPVGRFLPTKSARIGSSRWPRSTSTASCMALRAAELGHRVERGSDGAAGEEDVVDEHDDPAGDVDGHLGRAERLDRPQTDVVAVEGDVERADRDVARARTIAIASARRRAIAGPRVWRPMRTRFSAPWLRSTISWAMRVCARRRSEASNTRVRNTKRPPREGAGASDWYAALCAGLSAIVLLRGNLTGSP